MSDFHQAMHPDDLDERHKGDLIEDDPAPDDDGADENREPPDVLEPYTPFEQTKAYRDQLIDAGRGHLVK